MSIPYTYFIIFTHPKTNAREFYYGVQYGRTAHPDNLWTTYFTSSKAIKYRLVRYGRECFQYEVRRVFDCPVAARKWEERVLKRMKVLSKKEWLNRNDSLAPPTGFGCDNPFYGHTHTAESKQKMSRIKKEHHKNSDFRKKYLEGYINRDKSYLNDPMYKRKQHEGLIRHHSASCHEGLRQRMSGSNNPMYGKSHSFETRQKISDANKQKFNGHNNPMYGKQRSNEEKCALRELKKNTVWMNNGQTTKQVKIENVQSYLVEGWSLGRKIKE